MYANKHKSSDIQAHRIKPLLESFAPLFYMCKVLGLNSQNWEEFRRYKRLKKSFTGDCLVVVGIIITFINMNFMIWKYKSRAYMAEKSVIAIGIGFMLSYFSLALYISDRVNTLLKQQSFANLFLQLDKIDKDFRNLNIVLNNEFIKKRVKVGIVIVTFIEGMILTFTFVLFIKHINWNSIFWIYSCIPTYYNSLEKLWYFGILTAIRKRFEALNNAFDMAALNMEQKRAQQEKPETIKKFNKQKPVKKYAFKNQIKPVFGDVVVNPPVHSTIFEGNIYAPKRFASFSSDSSTTADSFYTTLEKKFVKFCQLHDTLCDMCKQLNDMYAFPTLVLMGYCFFITTAQLYFFYAANMNQTIPAIFQSARRWWVTLIYIMYIVSKCVTILYGNWLTSLESKKTGVCMHRCAMVADENKLYEMINHLSLKLFNHSCNFNACGYFPLNMTTLYGFCGGITTYLIILIQFNLEEQQVRISTANTSTKLMATTPDNFTAHDDVLNGTRSVNTTSFLY